MSLPTESFAEFLDRSLPITATVCVDLEDAFILSNVSGEGYAGYLLELALDSTNLGEPHFVHDIGCPPMDGASAFAEIRASDALRLLVLTSPEMRAHVRALIDIDLEVDEEAGPVYNLRIPLFPTPELYARFREIAGHLTGAHYHVSEPESPHEVSEHLRQSLNLILRATKGLPELRAAYLDWHRDWLVVLNESEVDHYTA